MLCVCVCVCGVCMCARMWGLLKLAALRFDNPFIGLSSDSQLCKHNKHGTA